jgi:hypothetical protein
MIIDCQRTHFVNTSFLQGVGNALTRWGFDDPIQKPPNETVTLCYQVA